MNRLRTTISVLAAVFSIAVTPSARAQNAPGAVRVLIRTTVGDIRVELDTLHAPVTSENFLRYVDAGLYDDGSFFRTVRLDNQPTDSIRIQVIQGGAAREKRNAFFKAIPLERTSVTGLSHANGAVSMARAGPDTATHSFFICIEDQPELDFGGRRNPDGQGFAAFAHVVDGMDVARKIQALPADGQTLSPAVRIITVFREREPE